MSQDYWIKELIKISSNKTAFIRIDILARKQQQRGQIKSSRTEQDVMNLVPNCLSEGGFKCSKIIKFQILIIF